MQRTEPNIRGLAALYSPTTGITDYARMTEVMADVCIRNGGRVRYAECVVSGQEGAGEVSVTTQKEGAKRRIVAGQVITAAGLHSDRVIRLFGQAPNYRVIPFRGEFFRILNQPADLVRHLIYPVPDPSRPFLGVHLTPKISGGFAVGPNAVLAFKREGYRLTDISMRDMAATLTYPGFWRLLAHNAQSAASELTASLSRRIYLKRVQRYCPRIGLADLAPYPAGVRAQAVAANGALLDDFLFIKTARCLHVGNAPSPAATAAIPIGDHIAGMLR